MDYLKGKITAINELQMGITTKSGKVWDKYQVYVDTDGNNFGYVILRPGGQNHNLQKGQEIEFRYEKDDRNNEYKLIMKPKDDDYQGKDGGKYSGGGYGSGLTDQQLAVQLSVQFHAALFTGRGVKSGAADGKIDITEFAPLIESSIKPMARNIYMMLKPKAKDDSGPTTQNPPANNQSISETPASPTPPGAPASSPAPPQASVDADDVDTSADDVDDLPF